MAGDIAGGALFPSVAGLIPGTSAHHAELIHGQENLLGQDLKEAQAERQLDEFQTWKRQNPTGKVEDYLKLKEEYTGVGKTPAEKYFHFATTPKENGGLGLDPREAFKNTLDMTQAAKPKTNAAQEAEFQKNIASMLQANPDFNPSSMMDLKKLTEAINNSTALTPEQKALTIAHLGTKTTPASQAEVANIRNAGLKSRILHPAIDKETGQITWTTALEEELNPGKTIPLPGGYKAATAEQTFADIKLNSQTVRNALEALGDDPLTWNQRALLSAALTEPKTVGGLKEAWGNFINSDVAANLSDKQQDYVTALYVLTENAMALRSVQGLGSGSDQLRGAIHDMLPGARTPSKGYAIRQLDLFDRMVDTVAAGVPKTGIKRPTFKPAPPIGGAPPAPKPGDMPPQDQIDKLETGHYIYNKDRTKIYQKQADGTLKEYKE
jgi:hypothetical protein